MHSVKILVVDDSRITLNLHASFLESCGFTCVKAENGFVALEILLKDKFDLIITDINMPKMDGYALTRKIRSYSNYSKTPIILASTEQEATDKMKGMEAGANLYVTKPVQKTTLLTQVNMLLQDQVHMKVA